MSPAFPLPGRLEKPLLPGLEEDKRIPPPLPQAIILQGPAQGHPPAVGRSVWQGWERSQPLLGSMLLQLSSFPLFP